MKLRLIQTGGFAGLQKIAEREVDWGENELHQFHAACKQEPTSTSARDAFGYSWELGENIFDIEPGALPAKYKRIFDEMHKELHVKKR
jgi:hypothetical protein